MNIVKSFPAYDIIEDSNHAAQGDKFAVFLDNGDYVLVRAGSVAGYAELYNEDAQEAVERAKENGHELYWLNPESLSLTAHEQAKRTYRALYVGQTVVFDGTELTIVSAPNRNFHLV